MSDQRPALGLREATAADARTIWEWRNDPAARAASFDSAVIPLDEHERWFAGALKRSDIRILIGLDDAGVPLGYARFSIDGQVATISTAVDPALRGRGFGAALIRNATERLLDDGIDEIAAYVKSDNPSSLAAFERAGYSQTGLRVLDGAESIVLRYRRHAGAMGAGPVVFRPDAGPAVGVGHLQRCLSLAGVLAGRGAAVQFVVTDEAGRLRVEQHGWPARVFSGTPWTDGDLEATAGAVAALNDHAVVVDADAAPAAYLDRLVARGYFVTVLDDLAERDFTCHLVVNGNADAGRLPYRASGETTVLRGPRYTILRPEFMEPAAPRGRTADHVLVMMGGADPCRLSLPIVDRILAEQPAWRVTVVAGPYGGQIDALTDRQREAGGRLQVVDAPIQVRTIMESSDLAISAAGQTLYELARLGTPTVAVQVAGNQTGQLGVFAAEGVVVAAGHGADPTVCDRVMAATARLAGDADARAAMRQAGRRMVDGRGALRVADVMTSLLRACQSTSEPA